MNIKPSKGKTGFITKLEAILSNQELSKIVCWSSSVNSFLILDAPAFESCVLGNYFRHKRMSSFIRQLNMYGFHKQRSEREALQFYHPLLQKDRPDLLVFIERKKETQLSFKENEPQVILKEPPSQHFFSVPCMTSIKVIEPELEDHCQPSFKFTGSKMTIRLNEALTSLCQVELEQEVNQVSHFEYQQPGSFSIGKNKPQDNRDFYNMDYFFEGQKQKKIFDKFINTLF